MEPEGTVLEAARILGVHPESVKRWIRYGELHAMVMPETAAHRWQVN
jgi:predicted site-specific integrase-resolvase